MSQSPDPNVIAMIAHYGFTPLPVEGTLFTSTYKASTLTAEGNPVGTAIVGMYCNEPLSRSLFHRLTADEVWHFYGGDPIRLCLLHPDGTSSEVILGPEVLHGHCVQTVIPGGTWQAGELLEGGTYGLFGCTMAPGFSGDGFEGGTVSALMALYPTDARTIERLGIPDGADHRLPDGYQD
jgi:predicted cupin superfamily sugar epimerase